MVLGAVSISSAAVEFSALKLAEDCRIYGGLEAANIAVIGAGIRNQYYNYLVIHRMCSANEGKMARLVLVHLETQNVKRVTVVNRSPDRVIELQNEFPGTL